MHNFGWICQLKVTQKASIKIHLSENNYHKYWSRSNWKWTTSCQTGLWVLNLTMTPFMITPGKNKWWMVSFNPIHVRCRIYQSGSSYNCNKWTTMENSTLTSQSLCNFKKLLDETVDNTTILKILSLGWPLPTAHRIRCNTLSNSSKLWIISLCKDKFHQHWRVWQVTKLFFKNKHARDFF